MVINNKKTIILACGFSTLLMAILMFFYELIKENNFAYLSKWQSHIVTICFTSMISMIITYIISNRFIYYKNIIELEKDKLVKMNAKINILLTEKETLLKEVNHRVKNNIAAIESFLSFQADNIDNFELKSALQVPIYHVRSLRVLYEKLLLSNDYQEISIKDYIESLIDSIMVVFPESVKVTIEKRITDFYLNSNKLVIIGMAINEILTNAFKYAFEGRDSGHISITIDKIGNLLIITVQDDGVGLNDDFDFNKSSGFGYSILKMITTSCTIENHDKGTRSILKFNI